MPSRRTPLLIRTARLVLRRGDELLGAGEHELRGAAGLAGQHGDDGLDAAAALRAVAAAERADVHAHLLRRQAEDRGELLAHGVGICVADHTLS